MEPKFIKFKTSSPSGDLISFLPGIKQMCNDIGAKAIIYQRLDMVGISYDGAMHPYENRDKMPVCFNEYTFNMMKSLLITQPYIENFFIYSGEEVDIDLDKTRMENFTNQPKGSLNRWAFYVFPQMATDLSKKWLDVNAIKNDNIIINFTKRHRNYFMNYYFLKQFENKIMFAGLKNEHEDFCKEWKLNIPLLEVEDFLELSSLIAGCKFFMGNQSFCFQLAEALKVPRILELFPLIPNVIPVGENAYDGYHQQSIEFYFNKLYNQFYER